MKNRILLIFVIGLALTGCTSTPPRSTESAPAEVVKLPQFDGVDTDGRAIRSDELTRKAVVVAFFDPDSVQAWRTLSKIGQSFQAQNSASAFLLGVAGSKAEPYDATTLNSLKKQYQISFPIIPDRAKRLSQVFQTPTCCDHLYLYDQNGILKNSLKLTDSYNNLALVLAPLRGDQPATTVAPARLSGADLYANIKVENQSGGTESLPIADHGLTVVNLFDQFCTECPTGGRSKTLSTLADLAKATPPIAVFSQENFSLDDVQNFKAILTPTYSLVQGNIDKAKPYLVRGKLLLVFDAKKNLVWQESPDMTEQDILGAVSRLLGSPLAGNEITSNPAAQ